MTAPALHLEFSSDGIARLIFDQPGGKANTLGQAVLTEFEAILEQLENRGDLKGLMLFSPKPGMFIAGADLKELGSPKIDPAQTRQLVERGLRIIHRFENLPFPTVALIDGACMGGGLEVALGFDYRLAGTHPKVEMACPEVKVGLIPGWGGTQRLSRVVGPGLAAELVCSGDSVGANRARELSLVFDVVPSEKLVDEAIRLINWSRETGDYTQPRRTKRQPVGLTEDQATFAFAAARVMLLAKTKGQLPAPLAALDVIEQGCNLPLEEGLKLESEAFIPLVGSTISRNLIALFFLGQKLAKDPGVAATGVNPLKINAVGVIGAGIMGAGIAGAHIRRGAAALLLDVNWEAVQKGVATIAKGMQGRVEAGRMKTQELIQAMTLLQTTQNLAMMADRDLVIEAVVENEEVKTGLFRQLEPHLKPHAILASNTSTISINRMAQAVQRPDKFAGLHFFNPVDRMPLVEVIRGDQTSDETVVTLVALAKRIGKNPIVVRDCPGFLVNRILFPYINESLALLEEGADPRAVDQAAVAFGMPMGPITLNDLVGLDTALFAGRVVNAAFADRAKNTRLLDELVKAGRLGQKSGAGFYSYAKGSRGADDPAFAAILDRCRTGQRSIDQEEITDRLFLAMLVEASLVLGEGIVQSPGDVDMGLLWGIAFPPFRGGLLRWADTEGLDVIVKKLGKYEKLGKRFQPTAEMRTLANQGKGFFGK